MRVLGILCYPRRWSVQRMLINLRGSKTAWVVVIRKPRSALI